MKSGKCNSTNRLSAGLTDNVKLLTNLKRWMPTAKKLVLTMKYVWFFTSNLKCVHQNSCFKNSRKTSAVTLFLPKQDFSLSFLLRNSEAKFFGWPLSFGNLGNCEYSAKERDSCKALFYWWLLVLILPKRAYSTMTFMFIFYNYNDTLFQVNSSHKLISFFWKLCCKKLTKVLNLQLKTH